MPPVGNVSPRLLSNYSRLRRPINFLTKVYGQRLKAALPISLTLLVGVLYHLSVFYNFEVAMADTSGIAIIPAPLSPNGDRPKADMRVSANERRRIFKQIIVKCVLQLLLIETTNELLQNGEVYNTIPPDHLLRLMGVLDHSYQFARMFNEDKDLRTALWKVGKCFQRGVTFSRCS